MYFGKKRKVLNRDFLDVDMQKDEDNKQTDRVSNDDVLNRVNRALPDTIITRKGD